MQPTSYPMAGTMASPGVSPMAGTMVSPGVSPMAGTMVSPGVNPMAGTMVSPGVNPMACGMYSGVNPMACGMYSGVNPMACGMYSGVNPMYNPGMYSMGMGGQPGYMTGMYTMNPSMSNPSVPITGISNPSVPITSVSNTNVPVNNVSNNQGNENNGEAPPSLLSRDTKLVGQEVAPIDGLINVYFEASTGSKAVLNIKETTPIKEALEQYADKINLNKQYIVSKKILFLYLNKQIDPNSTDPVSKLNIHNLSKINVFDQNNVLGA